MPSARQGRPATPPQNKAGEDAAPCPACRVAGIYQPHIGGQAYPVCPALQILCFLQTEGLWQACLCRANLPAAFFQQHLPPLCLCVTFGNSHSISNVFITVFVKLICELLPSLEGLFPVLPAMTSDNLQGRGPEAMKGLEVGRVRAVHVAQVLCAKVNAQSADLICTWGRRDIPFLTACEAP